MSNVQVTNQVPVGLIARSTGLENSRVLKTGRGVLTLLLGYSSKAGAQFIQLFDATAVPAEGTPPDLVFSVPATSAFPAIYLGGGLPFYKGLVICNSSTAPTKTIGAADCYFTGVID